MATFGRKGPKRIGVYPGKRLSLQSHNNRNEHWVVTKGKARVQLNEELLLKWDLMIMSTFQ
mgnify:CR=1 FL=1